MRFDAFFRAFYIGESDGHLKGYTTTWAIPKFFAESILRDEKSREKLPQDDMSYDKWFQGNASPRNHWANFALPIPSGQAPIKMMVPPFLTACFALSKAFCV